MVYPLHLYISLSYIAYLLLSLVNVLSYCPILENVVMLSITFVMLSCTFTPDYL